MERLVRTGLLYDFYGGLLTAKQQKALELYCLENWSLAEIAAQDGVSRQAVHDLLHRSERIMEDFEEKLGLLERFLNQKTVLNIISTQIKEVLLTVPENNITYKKLLAINQQLVQLIESETEV